MQATSLSEKENVPTLPQANKTSGPRNEFFFREMSFSKHGKSMLFVFEESGCFDSKLIKKFVETGGILVSKPACFVLRVHT